MAANNHTRVSTRGAGSDEGRPIQAAIIIERRMGKAVEGEKITLLFGSQMLVGRDQACEIAITDDRISRKHALIRIDDAARLSDLGSTNGTFRNDENVSEEIILESGDQICFGQGRTFEAKIVERNGVITSVRLASDADAYLLVPQELIIGGVDPKTTDVDLKLYDPEILPRHARIEFFAGQTFIVSLDPSRPVIVNSSPIRELEIRNNYLIEIGNSLIRFERMD